MDKTSTSNKLEETLQNIFITNLNFFKNTHPSIYKKIIKFEESNTEKYCINFVDDSFQLLDLLNNKNLYEDEPFVNALNRINNFDLGSAFNLIKIEPLEKRNFYDNEINAYEYLNEFINGFQDIYLEINKFIFLGTLLGIHIMDFHKVLNAKAYLIIEPNIEIFRLSMFITDYKILTKNSKLFFAIDENEYTLKEVIKSFLEYKYEFNNLIHFELAHKMNEPLINKLSTIFTHFGEMRYPFSDYLVSLNRFNYYIKENIQLVDLSKIYNFLKNTPILFLGAGPSLEKNLDYLKLFENNFIIVAVAATLKTLETKNIIPDIIITVDGQEIVLEQFKVNEIMYKNSIILSSIKLDKNLYSILKSKNLFFFQNSLNLFTNLGFITGITVGDMGIDILLRLGVKNLYLLGIDAAIDSKSGKTHIDTHSSSKKIDLNENNNEINFNKTIVYVKGNFETKVPTLMEYTEMIEEINEKFELLNNNNFKIYNLSNGAYFKNTIPLKVKEIKIKEKIDKNLFQNEFLLNLNGITKQNLNDIFIKNFEKERKILIKLNSLEKNISFFDEFKNIQQKYPNSISANILEKYFKLILPYYKFIKNKNISNEILKKQLEKVLEKLFNIF